jgi:uncharacterized membrane protein YagU involved in acid resistance
MPHAVGGTAMKKLNAIILGGLVAGVLDIIYAFIVYGPLSYQLSPMRVLQSVAAGWIGRDAATAGGWDTAMLGLGSHFMLATIFAAVFVLAATRLPTLSRQAVAWGLIYGFVLYVVMTYVVVPLSAAHPLQHFAVDANDALARLTESFSTVRPKDPWQLLGTILTHTVLVGVPIALINKRYA